MPTLYANQSANVRKTWILMTGFLVFIIFLGWFFANLLGAPEILFLAIFLSLAMNISAYWFSDKIALTMARAKETPFDQNPELYRIVENLAIAAGLPKPRIYLINEQQLNAFAAGRNAEHAVIAVTRGLLERLDRSELEGVLAHELSHIGNKDILVMTVIVVLAGFVAMLSNMFMRWTWFGGGNRDNNDSRGNAVLFAVGVAVALLAPLAATLIQLSVSRKREFLADATGALLTRYPDGLASALMKISADPTPLKTANNATAHLYFEDPFKGKQKANWMVKLFMTHPPVEERIAALRGLKI